MNPQLEGMENIAGTYPFDVRAASSRLRINRFFWNMRLADYRERFSQDERAACAQALLSDDETRMVLARDWLGLVRHGANFFVLEKFARLSGVSNLEVYATMRGESFDAFMATRKVPDAR